MSRAWEMRRQSGGCGMHERLSGQNTGRDTLRQDGIGRAAGMCRFFNLMSVGLQPAAPFGDCHIIGTSTYEQEKFHERHRVWTQSG